MLFRLCDFFSQFFFMSPKIPPFIFLVFCNRTNVKKSQRVPSLRFFGTMRLLKILIFLQNFSSLASILWNFATEWMLKKSQSALLSHFLGIMRIFKSNNFCLKIRLSQAQHAISDFWGHGNKFERISSTFNFEWAKFEFSKNRNKFESLCSNFEQTAVSIKRAPDISSNHLVPRGPLGPLMFPSC